MLSASRHICLWFHDEPAKQRIELAEELMREHRVPREWSFGFDRSKVRFGKCDYRRKRISLSSHLVDLNDEYSVRDTILHEIAHALAPAARATVPRGDRSHSRSVVAAAAATAVRCSDRNPNTGEPATPAEE